MLVWFKQTLIQLHRWLSLILLPLFALLIVSGGLLAFEPMIKQWTSGPAASEPVAADTLVRFLRQVDPRGHSRRLELEAGDRVVVEFSRRGQRELFAFDLSSGEPLEQRFTGAEFFRTVRSLHKDLLLNLALVVEITSYALLLVIIVGPLLAWPRLRHTLIGWHTVAGWIAFPLVLMITLTGVLLALNIATPDLSAIDRDGRRVSLAQAIERTVEHTPLEGVYSAERRQRTAVIVSGVDAQGDAHYLVTQHDVIRLANYPGLVAELHEGTWAGGWSGALNLLAALALLMLMVTGLMSWARRWRQSHQRSGDADAEILVAYASQTGTAARLATATAETLRRAGLGVLLTSLAGVRAAELNTFRRVLLIVSTTGDGQVPDQGRNLLKHLSAHTLSNCRFSLLALGDSSYTHFCAGGLTVRQALLAAGAQEQNPVVKADGDPSPAWQQWLSTVAEDLNIDTGTVTAPPGDVAVTLTLTHRQQLNDPDDADTNEVWSLEFTTAEPLTFRPGDLLLVSPSAGEPGRPYSIGSSALIDPRRILLTVALTRRHNAAGEVLPGKASGLLCRQLAVGDQLSATLRPHPNFNPPADPKQPMILVAAGCGIAPFIGFIAEQAAGQRTGPVWLVFGNYKRTGDFFYGESLQTWQQQGYLTRLDTAFSHDPEDGTFVQDRLLQADKQVLDWLIEQEGVLYACGRVHTVGAGVRSVLRSLLIQHQGLSTEAAAQRLQDWEAQGKLRLDLID